jgi:hypothetical protein
MIDVWRVVISVILIITMLKLARHITLRQLHVFEAVARLRNFLPVGMRRVTSKKCFQISKRRPIAAFCISQML